MTQNEKDILLKDLCARLPYGVNMATSYGKGLLTSIRVNDSNEKLGINVDPVLTRLFNVNEVKPYLFPLSSMTEEHKRELSNICKCLISFTDWEIYFPNCEDNNMGNWQKSVSWMYKNHYDINGLIPMGLANDATGLNIY